MKIIIYWNKEKRTPLLKILKISLDELGLSDFIKIDETNDSTIKNEMWIKLEPALIIEEESIDFKDTIFEWLIPPDDEIKAMLISIIWWDSWDIWCAPTSCGWCPSKSSCGI